MQEAASWQAQRGETGTRQQAAPVRAAHPSVILVDGGRPDEDLQEALRRIRSDPATAGRSILIVAREEGVPSQEEDGGAEEGEAAGEADEAEKAVVLQPSPRPRARELERHPEVVGWRAAGESVRRLGAEILAGARGLDVLVCHGRGLMEELRLAPYEGGRPALKKAVQRMGELMAWLEAGCRELLYVAAKAAHGQEAVRTHDLLRDAARVARGRFPGVSVALRRPPQGCRVFVAPFQAFLAFVLALEVLAERIGGRGRIEVAVDRGEYFLSHRLVGRPAAGAEGLSDPEPASLLRLRQLVTERLGGRIQSGEGGPEGSSLVLGLPLRSMEAEVREP